MASLKESTVMKLDRFDGANFRQWQKKLHFLLTSLNVVYVLATPRPEESEDETFSMKHERNKWNQDNCTCKSYIYNSISDELLPIFQNKETSKELWDALEMHYISANPTSKPSLVSKFFKFKMVETRSVVEQYHELVHIIHLLSHIDIHMDPRISVSAILDKLPLSWKDFKKNRKNMVEDLTIEDLGRQLQFEEDYRSTNKRLNEFLYLGKENKTHEQTDGSSSPKINLVDGGFEQSNNNQNSRKRKIGSNKEHHSQNPNKKKKLSCFYCNKLGHIMKNCHLLKKHRRDFNSREKFVAIVSEVVNKLRGNNEVIP